MCMAFVKRLVRRPHTFYATGSPIKAATNEGEAIVMRIYWIVIVSMGVSAFSYLTSSTANAAMEGEEEN